MHKDDDQTTEKQGAKAPFNLPALRVAVREALNELRRDGYTLRTDGLLQDIENSLCDE